MDTGLLAGAEADDGAVECVAYGIRLSIFEGEGSDDEVGDSALGWLEKSVTLHMNGKYV